MSKSNDGVSEHTPEPWHLGTQLVTNLKICVRLEDGGEYVIADTNWNFPDDAKANARRIVACVNACAGVPTELLEDNPAPFSRLLEERDELLAALDTLRVAFVIAVGDKSPFAKQALLPADAAIAKAKGGAA